MMTMKFLLLTTLLAAPSAMARWEDEFSIEYSDGPDGYHETLGPFIAAYPHTPTYGRDMSYQQAQDYCQDKFGTSLASMYRGKTSSRNRIQQLEMMQTLAKNGGPNARFWVGLRTNPGLEQFVWENGQYFEYKVKYDEYWRSGYPLQHSVDFSNDNCVMFIDDRDVTKLDVFDCFSGHLDYRHDAAGGRTMALCDNPHDTERVEYTSCDADIASYCAEGYSCDVQTQTCVACHGGDDGCNGVCSNNYRPVSDGDPGNMCVPCFYGGEDGQDVGCAPDEKCSLGRGYPGCGDEVFFSPSGVLPGVCTDRQECSTAEILGTNAECTEVKGDVKCTCNDGFECTTAGCTGIIECGEDTCDGAHGLCIDTITGSNVCSCDSGYELSDGNACILASVEPDALVNIMKFHNDFRANVNPAAVTPLPALTWNPDLAQFAQSHAEKCVFSHSDPSERNNMPGFANVGENIHAAWRPSWNLANALDLATVWPDFVTEWHDEVQNYDYTTHTCNGVCGHYTQIVWADTTEIGCGIARCDQLQYLQSTSPNAVILVCNYGPAGNSGMNRPYDAGTD